MTTVGVQRSKEEARRNSRWAEERAVHCRTPITEKQYGDQGILQVLIFLVVIAYDMCYRWYKL